MIKASEYCVRTTMEGKFDDAVDRVKAAFKEEGFGTLSEIDIRKALADKIGQHIEPYTLLGMCNPHLASRAIAAEHEIGVLLPCNVLVHECGGKVQVAAQDPILLSEIVDNEQVSSVAVEAKRAIERAMARLNS